jgi:hypothetical protein
MMIFSHLNVYEYNLYSFLSISDQQNKWLIKNAERPLLEVVIGLIEHFTSKEGDEDINAYFTQGPAPTNEVSIQF